jgi:dihydropteroate synthase
MTATAAETAARSWTLPLPGGRELVLDSRPGRARVAGIVNVTPDSFSDGGRYLDPGRAADHALALAAAGADLLDLGAESTRPAGRAYGGGAAAVPAEEEWRRLEPVLRRLRAETELPLSVDTRKGAVARRALDAGADLVNDVGALTDPELADAVAAAGCPVVLMHSRGDTATMQRWAVYADVAAEVRDELAAALARAEAAGIDRALTVVDPGLGFAKTAEHNYELLARLPVLAELGRPILVGASRKSFLGRAGLGLAPPDAAPDAPAGRLAASLAAAAWASQRGAAVVRVHDVAETVAALAAWRRLAEVATA